MTNTINKRTVFLLFSVIMAVLIAAFMIGIVIDPAGNQLNIFFNKMDNFFADFFNVLIYVSDKDPYFNEIDGYKVKIYLPLSYLLLYPFSCLDSYSSMTLAEAWNSKIGLISCILFTIISFAFFYFSLYKLGKSKKSTILILILLFFSYINIFSIERGNLIIISAIVVTVFLLLYNSSEKKQRWLALLCISIAAVLKVYPALFGLLLLIDKKYKSILICIAITIVLALVPFLFFQHGFGNIDRLLKNLVLQKDVWTVNLIMPRFGLSHLVHLTIVQFTNLQGLISISRYVIVLLSLISIILCFITKNNWLKIALLSVVIIQFPLNSGLYTGLYFFPVIILFFNKPFYTKKDLLYVLLFCLFLNPFQICIKGFSINYILANASILSIWMLLLSDIIKEIKPQMYLNKIFNKRIKNNFIYH